MGQPWGGARLWGRGALGRGAAGFLRVGIVRCPYGSSVPLGGRLGKSGLSGRVWRPMGWILCD